MNLRVLQLRDMYSVFVSILVNEVMFVFDIKLSWIHPTATSTGPKAHVSALLTQLKTDIFAFCRVVTVFGELSFQHNCWKNNDCKA